MKPMYKGVIVEESLLDNRILNDFKINNVRITSAENPEDRWHLYDVALTSGQINLLLTQLKPSGWYADFRSPESIVVVFPNKKFEFDYGDKASYDDVIAYGQSVGIPLEQLDFKITKE